VISIVFESLFFFNFFFKPGEAQTIFKYVDAFTEPFCKPITNVSGAERDADLSGEAGMSGRNAGACITRLRTAGHPILLIP
jgi:hypothetical protein